MRGVARLGGWLMAIAFVSASFTANGHTLQASPVTTVLTATTVAGNDVVVALNFNDTTRTITGITDNASPSSNTYTFQAGVSNGTTCRTEVWTAHLDHTNTSITISWTGGSLDGLVDTTSEFSGVVAIGTTATNSGSSTTPSVTLTTQDNNNFAVAGFSQNGGGSVPSFTASIGTLRGQTAAGSASTIGGAGNDNTVASPGSLTNQVTSTLNAIWAAAAVELRTSSGGGGGGPTPVAGPYTPRLIVV